jgi:NRPS condensation-like uncharacterized protein
MTETGTASFTFKRRFPVVLEDRILYWMRKSYDSSIRCVIEFDGRVNAARMARAIRLTLDAEPVLGCRFVRGIYRHYWEGVDNPDGAVLFEVLETSEYDDDMGAFIGALPPLNICNGPQVRAWLVRSEKDTLVICLQHVACDGVGAKDYLALLARIYLKLFQDPSYHPEPNLAGSRSLKQVLKNFSPGDYFPLMRRGVRDFYEFMFPLVRKTLPSTGMPLSRPSMIVHTLGPDLFRKFREYGLKRNATINDMLVTAFVRTFYGAEKPGENLWPKIVGTADLRRYLPDKKAGALCNLSGFTYLSIGPKLGETFEDTLVLLRDSMSALKNDFIGFGPVPLSALLFATLPFSAALWVHDKLGDLQKKQAASGRDFAPLFSNMGNIEASQVNFGDTEVRHAFITTPVATPPVLAIGLTGFRQSVTITAGFCETVVTKNDVKRMLDGIEKEISSLNV